jgi:hypothetical protein
VAKAPSLVYRPSYLYTIAAIGAALVVWKGKGFFVQTQFDHILLSNTSASENGILVSGQANPAWNYHAEVSSTASFLLGPLSLSNANNEVVAFTNHRAVAIAPQVPWTTGVDTVKVPLTGPIAIDVTVWILYDPHHTQANRVMVMKLAAISIWEQERVGVTFGAFDIKDVTSHSLASADRKFANCFSQTNFQKDFPPDSGRVNVYMLETVEQSAGQGESCGFGTGFIVMGKNPVDELLAHEIGHNLSLEHPDGLPTFDDTNVMYSASNNRQYFTEGQLFRAHMTSYSVLNNIFHAFQARPNQITRDCAQNSLPTDPMCPTIDRRVWADGPFPPN